MGTKELERVNYIVGVFKSRKNEVITAKEFIDSLQVPASTFYTTMQKIKKMYPKIVSYGWNKGCKEEFDSEGNRKAGYSWIEESEEVKEVKEEKKADEMIKETKTTAPAPVVKKSESIFKERYPDSKPIWNDEGHSDPTAYAAMLNWRIDECDCKRGDIWQVENSNGTMAFVAVVAVQRNSITCVPFYNDWADIPQYECDQAMMVNLVGKEVYVNVARLMVKPFKYFVKKVGEFSEASFGVLKGYIAMYLNLDGVVYVDRPVEKEVVKTVTERVEVPVEKIVEKEVKVPEVIEKRVEVTVPVKQEVTLENIHDFLAELNTDDLGTIADMMPTTAFSVDTIKDVISTLTNECLKEVLKVVPSDILKELVPQPEVKQQYVPTQDEIDAMIRDAVVHAVICERATIYKDITERLLSGSFMNKEVK